MKIFSASGFWLGTNILSLATTIFFVYSFYLLRQGAGRLVVSVAVFRASENIFRKKETEFPATGLMQFGENWLEKKYVSVISVAF